MNVIISNKNKSILDGLNIEVIKRLDGEYTVEDIVNTFQNFFFNKMIIDITSIKDYQNVNTIRKLSTSLDMSKVILLLDPNSNVATGGFLSNIISMGIYNFTTNLEGIVYLYNNPNSYRDVAQYHHIDNMIVEEEPTPVDTVSGINSNSTNNVDNFLDVSAILNNDSNSLNNSSNNSSNGINNIPNNDVVFNDEKVNEIPVSSKKGTKIIGIKSVTPGAGATTLTYLMKKHLERKHSVLAIEVEKRDFVYFNDSTLISCANGVIGDILSTNKDKQVLLVDLNGSQAAENYCDEILYLLEPSIIKINRLLSIKSKILNELKGKKVVLCPSLLSNKDVKEFEYESGLKIFYNMVPVDDHGKSKEVDELLSKLGF